MSSLGRVGCWWSEKKSRKFNIQEFSSVCRKYGFELVKIDLDYPLEEQGPFVAIVHKITDIILKADKGDQQAKNICDAFQKYLDDHPDVIVIDSLPNIRKLTDRYIQYNCVASDLSEKADIFIPAFVELNTTNEFENIAKLKAAGVDFPIVCKPTFAHGSSAHQMCIIFNEDGLKDVAPPCVAQKFINHNAVLYKLFTIGEKYFMIERPSLKNFTAGDQKTIFFNSHKISKPDSASELNELDDNDEQRTPFILPEKEKVDNIVEVLYKCFELNLLGIDFLIDNKTGQYGVVDINVFPGYDEVENFFPLLCELISEKISCKDKVEFKPVLLNSQIRSFHGQQKFSFDGVDSTEGQSKSVIPGSPPSYSYPKSKVNLNGLHPEKNYSTEVPLTATTRNDDDSPPFHSQYYIQDDSGIETSDSCDEKKELYPKTLKRLHFRINPATFVVDGSG